MIEPINVAMKNTLQKPAGSLKTNIPISAVPTAPMPVHTAYAVPIGRVCVAFTSRTILQVNAKRNPAYHMYIVVPVVSFAFARHDANATSNNPATINIIQFNFFDAKI